MLSDKEMIFHAIQQNITFNELNKMVFQCLRDWILRLLETEFTDFSNKHGLRNETALKRLYTLASAHYTQGNYKKVG